MTRTWVSFKIILLYKVHVVVIRLEEDPAHMGPEQSASGGISVGGQRLKVLVS